MFFDKMICRGVIAVSLTALVLGPVAAAQEMEAKQIYEKGINVVPGAGSNTAAVKYDVLLQRGSGEEAVATSTRFATGDKFRLRLQVNRKSYVYVLHRSIEGDPERNERYSGAKGIRIVHDEDRASNTTGKFTLLYPTRETGMANQLAPQKVKVVPEGGSGFQMDNQPGIEKLVIVVSPTPVDVYRMFSLSNARPNTGTGRRNDTEADLDNQLKSAEDNTIGSKGICVGECYAAPAAPSKPIIVNVDLRHYGR